MKISRLLLVELAMSVGSSFALALDCREGTHKGCYTTHEVVETKEECWQMDPVNKLNPEEFTSHCSTVKKVVTKERCECVADEQPTAPTPDDPPEVPDTAPDGLT